MEQKIGDIINSNVSNTNSNRSFSISLKEKDNLKHWVITTFCIAILSLIIAIISLCVSAYRTPNLSFDYLGIITGILGTLTTILIGFDIFKYIKYEKKIEELHNAIPQAICVSLAQLGKVLYNRKNYEEAIPMLLNSLAFFGEKYKRGLNDEAINYSITTLKEIQKILSTGTPKSFCCSKSDFCAFFLAAQNTGDKDLIQFVETFKIKE